MSKQRSDELLAELYQLHKNSGIGGEWKMVDSVFSFLRRKTPLLKSTEGAKRVRTFLDKHADQALKDKAKKKQKKAAAASAPTDNDEDVIEISTDKASGKLEKEPVAEKKQAEAEPEQKEAEKKGPAPVGNGGKTDKYVWSQVLSEVTVNIPIPAGTKGKNLEVDIGINTLKVAIKGQDPIIDGELCEKISTDDATWTLEDDKNTGGKLVTVYMPKFNRMTWWKCIIKGDPEIDTKLIEPENSKLDELDGDTRQTVEKMMFDQRQKKMGKPTSDEMQKQEALQKFMKMHPEMDFSNAKIS